METRKHYISSGIIWLLISASIAVVIQLFVNEKAMFIPVVPAFVYGIVELLLGISSPEDLKSN